MSERALLAADLHQKLDRVQGIVELDIEFWAELGRRLEPEGIPVTSEDALRWKDQQLLLALAAKEMWAAAFQLFSSPHETLA